MRARIIATGLGALAAAGCAGSSGPRESRSYANTGFDSVDAAAGVNVVLKQGPFAVTADGPRDELDRLNIEQDGSRLRIGHKLTIAWFDWTWSTVPTVITVSAPALGRIGAAAGADVSADGLQLTTLDLAASAGADVDLRNLKADALTVKAAAGADVKLAGTCASITIDAAAGADVDAAKLQCTDATVSASAGADVHLAASGKASARASVGADVRFHGQPRETEFDESVGGSIRIAKD